MLTSRISTTRRSRRCFRASRAHTVRRPVRGLEDGRVFDEARSIPASGRPPPPRAATASADAPRHAREPEKLSGRKHNGRVGGRRGQCVSLRRPFSLPADRRAATCVGLRHDGGESFVLDAGVTAAHSTRDRRRAPSGAFTVRSRESCSDSSAPCRARVVRATTFPR